MYITIVQPLYYYILVSSSVLLPRTLSRRRSRHYYNILFIINIILYYIILLSSYKTRQWTRWRQRPACSFSSITNLIRFPCPSPIPWTVYNHRCNYFNALLLIGRWRALSVVFVVPINHPHRLARCPISLSLLLVLYILYINRSTSGKYSSIPLTVGIIVLYSVHSVIMI